MSVSARKSAGHSALRRLRLTGGLTLVCGAGVITAGWIQGLLGQVALSSTLFRVAFFLFLVCGGSALPALRAAWLGRLHPQPSLTRQVPFFQAEFRENHLLHPGRSRSGVVGRGALVGLCLLALAALMWMGGLGFASQTTTGLLPLRLHQSSIALSLDSPGQQVTTDFSFNFTGFTENGGASFSFNSPRTGGSGAFALSPAAPILLERHRLTLSERWSAPPITGVDVRAVFRSTGEHVDFRLSPEQPFTQGDWSWSLADFDPSFLRGQAVAFQIREEGPDSNREVWLLPAYPNLDRDHHEGAWSLIPLRSVLSDGVTIRLTTRWVWHWRVAIVALVGLGIFLVLLSPHRSWLWVGQDGDFELRVWSLGAASSLRGWSDVGLKHAMVDGGFEELIALDQSLSKVDRPREPLEAAGGEVGRDE